MKKLINMTTMLDCQVIEQTVCGANFKIGLDLNRLFPGYTYLIPNIFAITSIFSIDPERLYANSEYPRFVNPPSASPIDKMTEQFMDVRYVVSNKMKLDDFTIEIFIVDKYDRGLPDKLIHKSFIKANFCLRTRCFDLLSDTIKCLLYILNKA